MSRTLKIMTFNLRTAVKSDTPNSFWERKPRILQVIEREDPDIIGFQEATDEMRLWAAENLRDYTVIGCGRGGNYRGESVATAFKSALFSLISLDHYWMSPTPGVPGSRFPGDQSSCPRITSVVRLVVPDETKPFCVYNTHLDHKGAGARYLGMMQNVQRISGSAEKFVFTGDMNATPDAPEIGLVTEALGYRGAVDCTVGLGNTFHGFKGGEGSSHIDYIFTDGRCESAYVVADPGENGLYYSDHLAVCALITL